MLIANSSFRFGIVLSPQHRLVAWTCRKVDFRSPKPRSRSIFRRFYYAGNPRNWVSGSFCWRTIYSAARSKLFSPEHRIGNLQQSVQASGRPARGGGRTDSSYQGRSALGLFRSGQATMTAMTATQSPAFTNPGKCRAHKMPSIFARISIGGAPVRPVG